MPRRQYPELPPTEILARIRKAGLKQRNVTIGNEQSTDNEIFDTESLDNRIRRLLGIIQNTNRNSNNMLFFVMYDIESNKVRRLVAKYLLRQGCIRIQNSVFLADLDRDTYASIRDDLTEVQAVYDNPDSILIVPISTDYLKSMKIIGKSIDVDIIMGTKNTLFF